MLRVEDVDADALAAEGGDWSNGNRVPATGPPLRQGSVRNLAFHMPADFTSHRASCEIVDDEQERGICCGFVRDA